MRVVSVDSEENTPRADNKGANAIDNNPAKILKAGDTFYEPTGCLHGVGKNPSKKNKTRFIATVLHPEDAKDLVIPEKEKK